MNNANPKFWQAVSAECPCPICGKTDWTCRFGDYKMLCERAPSDHPNKGGGWFHDYPASYPVKEIVRVQYPKRTEPNYTPPVGEIMRKLSIATPIALRHSLAASLGVLVESVMALGASWYPRWNAWAFTMRDGWGEPCGIRLRNNDGKKWTEPNTRNGLFIPQYVIFSSPLFICEGPTSLAAALSLGLSAIGRPSCNACDDMVKVFIRANKIHKAIIIADKDSRMIKTPQGKEIELRPGVDGAKKLKKAIGIRSAIWIPPFKDIRQFYNNGGTRSLIDSDVNNLIWS
jgi:hypothetical protein